MTKAARDYTAWTNREIESDPSAYLAAQRAHREDEAAASEQRAEQLDKERFTQAFVAAGGREADADAAYRERRNERAVEAARTADEAARRLIHGHTMGKV